MLLSKNVRLTVQKCMFNCLKVFCLTVQKCMLLSKNVRLTVQKCMLLYKSVRLTVQKCMFAV